MFNMQSSCCGGIRCSCSFPPPFAIIEPWRGSAVNALDSISGRGTPGALIRVKIDGNEPEYNTTVGPDGWWTIDGIQQALSTGSHTIYAVQETGYGCSRGCEPFELPFIIEVPLLPTPTIINPANGAILNPGPLVANGTATPGNIVSVCLDGLCTDVRVEADGTYEITVADPISRGVHFVTVTERDDSTGQVSLAAVSEFTVLPYVRE